MNAQPAALPGLLSLARFASTTLPLLLLGAIGLVLLAGRPQLRDGAARVLLAMALVWLAARSIQSVFPLPRPFVLGLGTAWLPHASSAGFPSTHASVAQAFSVALALMAPHRSIALLALLPAILIGWSRVCLGLHFPSDVLTAMLLGTLCALLVWRFATPRRSGRKLEPHLGAR